MYFANSIIRFPNGYNRGLYFGAASVSDDYSIEKNKKYTLKLRKLLEELPVSCSEYFRGIESSSSVMTRYGYALDLRLFFKFLLGTEICKGLNSIRDIDYSVLDKVETDHVERFLEYISLYPSDDSDDDDELISNGERGKARKLSSIRSYYRYLYRKGKISGNAPSLVETPKIHDKPIIRLDINEIADLLDIAEDGEGLTETQKKYHKLTKIRDVAIITLFLGTGMRISELVGIDIDDLNFLSNEVRITRKGGNQDVLVFGDEVRTALLDYMLKRETMTACDGHENAFFLSLQHKRMSVRSVEILVKKYAKIAAPLKKISPHKLRSTYGTMLYNETGDIYLVADVLGHRDVNTTKKHYAAIAENRRRRAAEVIKLRDDEKAVLESVHETKNPDSQQAADKDE